MLATNSYPVPQSVHCAIYTRKSTEEGLDKEFNSLEAQREAAEAYIQSQQSEGWTRLQQTYDDGGFTGANMDRPALARLLTDIEQGQVDCVVVYKVDRLSRSLVDFARIMSEFDKHGVTFVSVTQQFNTSTPVGRLTLHILLSFAQFEREIISERTRDKKAASKRKGKWTGGFLPLGYDLDPHGGRLVINPKEAERVREIFELFLELRSVDATVEELDRRGWTTKTWMTRNEKPHRGTPFTGGSLRRLLANPLYTGVVAYRGQSYRGEHPRIVEPRLWKRVHHSLAALTEVVRKPDRNRNGALLQGLVHCAVCGKPMSSTYTVKGERRYRYYVCRSGNGDRCASVAAQTLEAAVLEQLDQLSRQPEQAHIRKQLKPLGRGWMSLAHTLLLEPVRRFIERITFDATNGRVTMRPRTGKGNNQ